MWRPLAALLGLAWVALEIWLFYLVGSALGALGAVLLLVAGAVAGITAVKASGRRAMRALARAAEQAQAQGRGRAEAGPEREVRGGDHALAILGGLLLAFPTFGTDVLGLLCLFPPTRALLRRGFGGLAASRLVARTPFGRAMADARAMGDQVRIHEPGVTVVPGEVVPEPSPPGTDEPSPRVIEGTIVDGSTTRPPDHDAR